ncbi:MAG: DUF502 domain-containing protein [Sedimentisphaerales bacterium]|jgi:uncharacterized membrane protein
MAKGRFRGYFLRGLGVLLPTVLTIWLILWGFNFINDKISVHIKHLIIFVITLAGGSETILANFWISWFLSIAGFLIALGIVYIAGIVLASVLGRSIWQYVERLMANIPLLKQIYPYIKQMTDFFFKQEETKKIFSRVVAVEYPRKGIWSVGYVTGSGIKKIVEGQNREFVTVLIPTAPTPFGGFLIIVPKEEVVDLNMSIEEALRFILSAGVIVPGEQNAAQSPAGSE